jgi:hypothetical protein
MIKLPDEFVSTRYPGYFWNVLNKKLYSLKVHGELKPMALQKAVTVRGVYHPAGYRISVRGMKTRYTLDYLHSLKQTNDVHIINVQT